MKLGDAEFLVAWYGSVSEVIGASHQIYAAVCIVCVFIADQNLPAGERACVAGQGV